MTTLDAILAGLAAGVVIALAMVIVRLWRD